MKQPNDNRTSRQFLADLKRVVRAYNKTAKQWFEQPKEQPR